MASPAPSLPDQDRWHKATRRLSLGVAFATVLMLLYNVLLFIPITGRLSDPITTKQLLLYIAYVLLAFLLAFVCIRNYMRGISRFATLFEQGGKRSLYLVRIGFVLSIAGIVLQLFVFGILPLENVANTLQLIIGNSVIIAACVVGIIGFLSLAASKGMTDLGRRGALHMSWISILLTLGAILLSYSLHASTVLKVCCVVVNVVGAVLFYRMWNNIIAYPEQSGDEPAAVEATEVEPQPQNDTPLEPDTTA